MSTQPPQLSRLTKSHKATNPVHPERLRQAQQHARYFEALANETRLLILQLLSEQLDTISVSELVSRFSLEQPTISHHLRILRDAGFVECSKKGLYAYYSVRRERVEEVRRLLQTLLPPVETVGVKQPAYRA